MYKSIQCTCLNCGWTSNFMFCDNGDYEPPTCFVCESSNLRYDVDNEDVVEDIDDDL